MKFKMIMLTVLISSGLVAVTNEVNAAQPAPGISQGSITLEEGSGATDPEVPTLPPGETGNTGNLTIDNVAPLAFATHELKGSSQVYTSTVDNSNIQVTDKRGTEAGWSVQVSKTKFKDTTDSTKELKGSKLVVPVGTIFQTTNVSVAPKLNAAEITENATVLMNAEVNSGAGTWTNIFDKKDVQLTIPPGNKAGEYESTVTWALMDAPN